MSLRYGHLNIIGQNCCKSSLYPRKDPCTWSCALTLYLIFVLPILICSHIFLSLSVIQILVSYPGTFFELNPCTRSCILFLYSILVPDSGFSSHWLFSSLSGPCRSVQIPALEPRRLNAPLCRYRRTRHELLTSSRSRQRNPGRLRAALLFSR